LLNKNRYSHIIWDWNGTLFDDVDWCVTVVNKMLAKRDMKQLDSVVEYHNAFCFPVINYYKNVGFDFEKESFDIIAKEFIAFYHAEKSGGCKLCKNARFVLQTMQESGKSQVILSASETNNLISQINEFDIYNYFDEILGISNIYAASKIDIGLEYMTRKKVEKAVLIGDTEHDCEVAKALAVDCILIANGHQSKDKLLSCKVPVLDDISQVIEYID
jgi:phosphoglycolate phosphatase